MGTGLLTGTGCAGRDDWRLARSGGLKAVRKLGADGVEAARELADEIEALLVGAREGRVELEGTRAFAVVSVLKVAIADPASPFVSASYSLYQALRTLHN